MESRDCVFISYAREDQTWAERLYMDLRKQEVDAWLDIRSIAAGANWQHEIKKAIRRSRYFILLLSKHSVNKRGFIQKEMKEAIRTLEEFPKGEIFLIPARLDGTEPIDDELRELNWVDLAPEYHDGLARILSSILEARREPLVVTGGKDAPSLPATFIDKGREITLELPLLIGPRAPVNYAPFRSKHQFLQQFFDRLPTEYLYTDRSLSYYITLETQQAGVLLGDDLKAKYPDYITLVLQNAFRDLQARRDGVSVILSFDGVERMIGFPYDAVIQVRVPEIGLRVLFEAPVLPGSLGTKSPGKRVPASKKQARKLAPGHGAA